MSIALPVRLACLLGVVLLGGGFVSCGEAAEGSPGSVAKQAPLLAQRSMLVVTFDTTRSDFVGTYGSALELTPNLDALATRGVVFEDAYAPMPQTLPSHATLFTGLPPRQHRALENTYELDERYSTLAEAASEQGYQTAAFVGAAVLSPETGIHQGFDVFDMPTEPGTSKWEQDKLGHPPQRSAKQVTDAALAWLAQRDDARPFLLWVHYYDPHGDAQPSRPPYHVGFTPPARHVEAVPRSAIKAFVEASASEWVGASPPKKQLIDFWRGYAAELRFTDEQLGRVLRGLESVGLDEQTVVVVAGDHGEGLYEHDVKGHGVALWEEAHRIPLVIATPDGALAGTRVRGAAFLRDVRPTLERLVLGAPPVERGDDLGVDLWAAAEAGRGLTTRPVFLERPHFPPQRAAWRNVDYGVLASVSLGGGKLIRQPDGSRQLFDLVADPAEQQDLADEQPERADKLEALLDAWEARNPTGDPGSEARSLDCEQLKQLVALGYLGQGEAAHCD